MLFDSSELLLLYICLDLDQRKKDYPFVAGTTLHSDMPLSHVYRICAIPGALEEQVVPGLAILRSRHLAVAKMAGERRGMFSGCSFK